MRFVFFCFCFFGFCNGFSMNYSYALDCPSVSFCCVLREHVLFNQKTSSNYGSCSTHCLVSQHNFFEDTTPLLLEKHIFLSPSCLPSVSLMSPSVPLLSPFVFLCRPLILLPSPFCPPLLCSERNCVVQAEAVLF